MKLIFFFIGFELSRIRDRRSHTCPKSCALKFRAITQALQNAPKRLPAINRYLFSILTYHSILNFSNTPTGVIESVSCSKKHFRKLKTFETSEIKKETNGVGGKSKLIAKLIDDLSVF